MGGLAPGVQVFQKCTGKAKKSSIVWYQGYVWILTFITYAAFHASRKPIAIVRNAPSFLEHHNVTHETNETSLVLTANDTDFTANDTEQYCTSFIDEMNDVDCKTADNYLNLMGVTTFLISYAIFMFVSGEICERMDKRYYLAIACTLSGLFTFLFGLAYSIGIRSIWYFIALQVALGAVQSMGWPGVVSVMANWFGKGKRGLIFGIWNSHTSVGNIIGTAVAGAFVTEQFNYDWGLSFIVPGVMIGSVGIFLFFFLIPVPDLVGLQPPQQHDPTEEKEDPEKTQQIESTNDKAIGIFGALKIPGVVEFSLCLFFAKLVSYVFFYQLAKYIHATTGMDAEQSATLSEFFDWGGIIGGIVAGMITDYSGMSGTTCSVMLVIAIPLLFCYETLVKSWCPIELLATGAISYDNSCYAWNVVLLMLVGLFVNGPYALITTAVSAELGNHKSLKGSGKALATVTAIIDGTGSIGAAVGPTIGQLLAPAEKGGSWDMFFYMLMAADVIALLMLGRIVKHEIESLIERRRTR